MEIKTKIKNELNNILRKNMTQELIPKEFRAAPDVYEVWKGTFASFQIWEMVDEMVEAIEDIIRKEALGVIAKKFFNDKNNEKQD